MSTIFHIGVKEKHDQSNDGDRLIAPTPDRLSRLSLFRNPKMYAVGCIYVATRLFVNLSQVYIPYYIHTYLRLMSKKLAILPLVMYISSFITSIVVHQLNVHFGRKVRFACNSKEVFMKVEKLERLWFPTTKIHFRLGVYYLNGPHAGRVVGMGSKLGSAKVHAHHLRKSKVTTHDH